MSDKPEDETSDDSALRAKLDAEGFKPSSDGMRWASAQPKILVAGAYKVIRTAAERAREALGKSRE